MPIETTYQLVKLGFGDAGYAVDVTAANPLPVSATVVFPPGATVAVSNFPAVQAVSGPLTDAQLRAAPVPVSGSFSIAPGTVVDVGNFPAVQAVSGTVNVGNFPATQAVTGPLTDAQLRATPVPVSGTVTVGGSVAVSNFPATQAVTGPLTDAQLRASPVPVTLDGGTGEVVDAIEATRTLVQSLERSIGQVLPDTANRLRVNIEAGTLPTVTTVSTVTTVTTVVTVSTVNAVANIISQGNYPAQMPVFDQNKVAWAQCVRARIT